MNVILTLQLYICTRFQSWLLLLNQDHGIGDFGRLTTPNRVVYYWHHKTPNRYVFPGKSVWQKCTGSHSRCSILDLNSQFREQDETRANIVSNHFVKISGGGRAYFRRLTSGFQSVAQRYTSAQCIIYKARLHKEIFYFLLH